MKTTEEILTDAGNVFVKRLQDQFDAKGLNDTGRARNSLSSSVDGKTLKIEGLLRTVVLITGRKPGGISIEGQVKIGEWITRKLGIEKDSTDWKRAKYFIIKKIIEKGTDIFTDRSKGLQIELIIDELNEELFKDINNQMAFEVTNTIFEAYQ